MKIIVMSDSHGAVQRLMKVVELHMDADCWIHLGDGERDVNHVLLKHPEIRDRFYCLEGNCDGGRLLPQMQPKLVLSLPGGHRIFAAHGDMFQVKHGTEIIEYEASRNHADIILYGHTHFSECRYQNGGYIINPGSIGRPRGGEASYALLHVTEQGILPSIVPISI